jgi:hypothetical protein
MFPWLTHLGDNERDVGAIRTDLDIVCYEAVDDYLFGQLDHVGVPT